MLDRKDGTDASRCMSNCLQMYRPWLNIAAEVRELLCVLFIRFRSVPADSGRTTSTQLKSISRGGLGHATCRCLRALVANSFVIFSMSYLAEGCTRIDLWLFATQLPCSLFYSAWQFSAPATYSNDYWTFGAPGEIRTPDPQIRSLRVKSTFGTMLTNKPGGIKASECNSRLSAFRGGLLRVRRFPWSRS
jgi:hypothetical protein